jgi:hypothetical protein
MVLPRSDARTEARAALQDYLTLSPDAADKAMVAMLIDQASTSN